MLRLSLAKLDAVFFVSFTLFFVAQNFTFLVEVKVEVEAEFGKIQQLTKMHLA